MKKAIRKRKIDKNGGHISAQIAEVLLGLCLFLAMTGALYVGLKTLTIIVGGS